LKQRAALAKAAEAQQQEKHSGGNLHNKNRIFTTPVEIYTTKTEFLSFTFIFKN